MIGNLRQYTAVGGLERWPDQGFRRCTQNAIGTGSTRFRCEAIHFRLVQDAYGKQREDRRTRAIRHATRLGQSESRWISNGALT